MSVHVGFFGTNRNRLGESPLWDEANQCLWWVDALAVAAAQGHVRGARHDGTPIADWHYNRAVGSIALARQGLVAAMADGFYSIDPNGKETLLAQCGSGGAGLRFNDGKLDRSGRFVAGELEIVAQAIPSAALWRLDLDGRVTQLADGLRLANATCFSPRGDLLYFADSPEGVIRVHRYDPARPLGPQIATIDCRRFGSIPDGATIDRDGNLWVTLVMAQSVVCLAPDGALIRQIDLPVPFPSCPAFGGPGLATLFVTTIANSGRHLASDHPDAGRIVAIQGLGTCGIAEASWGMAA